MAATPPQGAVLCDWCLAQGRRLGLCYRKTDYESGFLKIYRAYKIALKNKSPGFIRAFDTALSRVFSGIGFESHLTS
jgi:hypothetical protein